MKVAIAGYGVEGKASLAYWLERGDAVTIVDERLGLDDAPDGVPMILGSGAFSRLNGFDMVVRSPSLRPDKITTDGKVWSATNEFFAKCPAPIIGVTGTKGKGTTSSLIASILRAAGKTVHLVGNIGVPVLEILPEIIADDVVVFEISSFQLWDLETSPHIAVVLMIEPDHLDVHANFDEYVNAKANIVRYQTPADITVFNKNNLVSQDVAEQSIAQKVSYPFESELLDVLVIPGAHNRDNACAAIAAVRPWTENPETIREGLANFTGLPHRLKFIREVDGVKYYDDNYSSAPGATIAAVKSFENPEILILGGYDKQIDFDDLTDFLSQRSNLRGVVLLGQTGPRLNQQLRAHGFDVIQLLEDQPSMEKIVATAKNMAQPGDVVIMSPACASFDMFKNFTDRGDRFIQAVEAL